jgi:TFIIF-interacting CTD phosphatase-like protein
MKKLIILDIDETLIHSKARSDSGASFVVRLLSEEYHVYTRCYLAQFIKGLKEMMRPEFRIAVWTAATRDYAVRILDHIWPTWRGDLLFLRSRSHCTILRTGEFVKDLSRLPQGYDILLIDDNTSNFQFNTRRHFAVWKISPFRAPMLDAELMQVLSYLRVHQQVPFTMRPKTPAITRQNARHQSRSGPPLAALRMS